jgi:hypothetical protein
MCYQTEHSDVHGYISIKQGTLYQYHLDGSVAIGEYGSPGEFVSDPNRMYTVVSGSPC